MNRWMCLICALLLAYLGATARADDTKVTVDTINDYRYSTDNLSPSRLSVALDIESASVAHARAVRGVLSSATDNTGQQLADDQKYRDKWSALRPDSKRANLSLGANNPPRAAQTLREIAGRVEFYFPQRDPKSVVKVENIGARAGQTLDDATLKAADLGISVSDKAQVKLLQAEMVAPLPPPQSSGMNAVRTILLQEFARRLLENSSADLVQNDQLNPRFVVLRLQDPRLRLVDIEFETAQGQPLKSDSSFGFKDTKFYKFDAPLPPNARLQIYVATPQSVVDVPFEIKNIALP